jgi:hypothetical protein
MCLPCDRRTPLRLKLGLAPGKIEVGGKGCPADVPAVALIVSLNIDTEPVRKFRLCWTAF